MTVYTLQAAIPEITIVGGMKIVLEAVSPTTGSAITGVSTTEWAIYGTDVSGSTGKLLDLIPDLTPQEVESKGV